jgi:tetratricopeptide (TPR) repeat protein
MAQNQANLLQQAMLAHRKGDLAAAERLYGKVLDFAPRDLRALHLLGVIRARQRRFDEAEQLIARALAIDPNNGEAQNNLGSVLLEQGRAKDAVPCFRQALALRPGYAEAYYNLGNALAESDDTEGALVAYRAAIGLRPDYRDALLNLGLLLRRLGQTEEALGALRHILKIRSGDGEAWNAIGHVLEEAGQGAEAIQAYDRALALAPNVVGAYFDRINAAKVTAEDGLLARLQALAARRPDLSPRDRALLHFALGKGAEDLGHYEEAFAHLAEANREKRAEIAYDEAGEEARMNRVIETFTPALMESLAGQGSDSERPIFVLGFPRSGTTLVEQILASHPEVYGAGELGLMPQLARELEQLTGVSGGFPEAVARLPAWHLRGLGELYVERLSALAPGARHITDKLPGNYVYIGLIRLILPRAKIVHVRRDPMDTCISCFAHSFAGEINFAYDLEELGRAYRRYQALMAHWRSLVPTDSMLEIDYEALVGDLEGEARRMVAHCGLAWDERCLAFHETGRTVRTASVGQVRQPIYSSSLQRWRRYGQHLAPLEAALAGVEPESLRTGAG